MDILLRSLVSLALFAIHYFAMQATEAWHHPSLLSSVPRKAAAQQIQNRRRGMITTCLYERRRGRVYTKGAEIYPSCNNRQFTLADSFPNGVIPPQAQSILKEKNINLASLSSDPMTTTTPVTSSSRRDFLLLGGGLSTLAAIGTVVSFQSSKDMSTSTTTTAMDVSTAIEWLDKYCDRRFLHAVVASDYRFLYYGIGNEEVRSSSPPPKDSNGDKSVIRTVTLTPDLLSVETYGTQEAVDYFQRLESTFYKELVKPSNGHLMTTTVEDAAEWGSVASMWPMDRAHFAWFQDMKRFYPREDVIVNGNVQELLIVDGKDCGREGLEDALRSNHCEILVNASQFLVVPIEFEEELRNALKSSFLV